MQSKLFHLAGSDFSKGLIVAVLAPVFLKLSSLLNTPGFDVGTLDAYALAKIGLIAGCAYLFKNLLSDESGKVFGKIG